MPHECRLPEQDGSGALVPFEEAKTENLFASLVDPQ